MRTSNCADSPNLICCLLEATTNPQVEPNDGTNASYGRTKGNIVEIVLTTAEKHWEEKFGPVGPDCIAIMP